jgi:hypothetical protein
LDLAEDASAEAAALAFAAELPSVHPINQAFWDGYARAAGLTGAPAEQFADRAVQYCAVRLIQSAFEWGQAEVTLPPSAAAILQLGTNLLHRPAEARRVVLALGDPVPL